MQHEYTDDQVNEAIMLANRTGKVYAWETKMYRDVIKHLPRPQDDWQNVTDILQVRRGDMLKNETENAAITYKYAVKRVNLSDGTILFDNDEALFWDDNHTISRIPAPVVHPDPAQHPIIMEQGGKGWVWIAQHEMYYQPHSTEYRFPEGFPEWSPAQIISDEPAEVPR